MQNFKVTCPHRRNTRQCCGAHGERRVRGTGLSGVQGTAPWSGVRGEAPNWKRSALGLQHLKYFFKIVSSDFSTLLFRLFIWILFGLNAVDKADYNVSCLAWFVPHLSSRITHGLARTSIWLVMTPVRFTNSAVVSINLSSTTSAELSLVNTTETLMTEPSRLRSRVSCSSHITCVCLLMSDSRLHIWGVSGFRNA